MYFLFSLFCLVLLCWSEPKEFLHLSIVAIIKSILPFDVPHSLVLRSVVVFNKKRIMIISTCALNLNFHLFCFFLFIFNGTNFTRYFWKHEYTHVKWRKWRRYIMSILSQFKNKDKKLKFFWFVYIYKTNECFCVDNLILSFVFLQFKLGLGNQRKRMK